MDFYNDSHLFCALWRFTGKNSVLDNKKRWIFSQIISVMNPYYEKPSTTKGLRYPQSEGYCIKDAF